MMKELSREVVDADKPMVVICPTCRRENGHKVTRKESKRGWVDGSEYSVNQSRISDCRVAR